jgi:hypothetical protein
MDWRSELAAWISRDNAGGPCQGGLSTSFPLERGTSGLACVYRSHYVPRALRAPGDLGEA